VRTKNSKATDTDSSADEAYYTVYITVPFCSCHITTSNTTTRVRKR